MNEEKCQQWIDEVVKKATYCRDDNKLRSDSWSLGGTVGSCWSSEKRVVDAETPPAAFEAFDELLMKLCPNIGFMQYKVLYNRTVKTDSDWSSDYYGGSTSHAWYECDLVALYSEMLAMGLIPDGYQ